VDDCFCHISGNFHFEAFVFFFPLYYYLVVFSSFADGIVSDVVFATSLPASVLKTARPMIVKANKVAVAKILRFILILIRSCLIYFIHRRSPPLLIYPTVRSSNRVYAIAPIRIYSKSGLFPIYWSLVINRKQSNFR